MVTSQPVDGSSLRVEFKCHRCKKSNNDITLYPIELEDNEKVMMCADCIPEYDQEVADEQRKQQIRATIGRLRKESNVPPLFKSAEFRGLIIPERPGELFNAKELSELVHVRDAVLKFMEYVNQGSSQLAAFLGDVGTGKTHFAAACINEVISKGDPAKFYHASRLIRILMSNESYQSVMNEMLSNKLIVIDDINSASRSEFSRKTFSDIIDHCYTEQVSLILTGNGSQKVVMDNYLGRPGMDRIEDSPAGGVIRFKWRSLRGRLKLAESTSDIRL